MNNSVIIRIELPQDAIKIARLMMRVGEEWPDSFVRAEEHSDPPISIPITSNTFIDIEADS